jgi:glucose/arabinose dehydrogenase
MLFQQNCALCHDTGAEKPAAAGQGPILAGVVGRPAASTDFGYSKALRASHLTWDEATLDRFLTDPAAVVPGTTMPIATASAADRRDLIAYLASLPAAKSVAPPSPIRPATAPAPNKGASPGDWRNDAPGVVHAIRVESLPRPYATDSVGNGPHVVDRPAGARLAVPAGFTVRQFASGLSGPRLLRVAPNGDIFISETRAGRIRVLRAADGADHPSENKIFADHLHGPFGLAFYPAGPNPQWVYVANLNSVIRFPYRNGDLAARGPAETIVPQLAETTGGHSTRDVAFSPDGRRLFISVGSGSNVAEDLPKKSPGQIAQWEAAHGLGAAWGSETNRADILQTDPEGKLPLHTFATGIRNPVGLAIDPTTGELWASTNERDRLGDNLVPDYITHVREGSFYGWPWYYIGSHEDPRHAGERSDLAGQAIVPDVLVQPHSASLEIAFYTADSGVAAFPAEYRGSIFAALHGSWNRGVRTGSKVIRVLFKNGAPTGEYEDFLTGFVVDNRSVWGRPVGVAVAHDGALLVTEDANDTVWRISYTGKSGE